MLWAWAWQDSRCQVFSVARRKALAVLNVLPLHADLKVAMARWAATGPPRLRRASSSRIWKWRIKSSVLVTLKTSSKLPTWNSEEPIKFNEDLKWIYSKHGLNNSSTTKKASRLSNMHSLLQLRHSSSWSLLALQKYFYLLFLARLQVILRPRWGSNEIGCIYLVKKPLATWWFSLKMKACEKNYPRHILNMWG